jgi:hypothetical protein
MRMNVRFSCFNGLDRVMSVSLSHCRNITTYLTGSKVRALDSATFNNIEYYQKMAETSGLYFVLWLSLSPSLLS